MTKKTLTKGNYPKKDIEVKESEEEQISKFEKAALKKLGGSIAFVRSKTLTE